MASFRAPPSSLRSFGSSLSQKPPPAPLPFLRPCNNRRPPSSIAVKAQQQQQQQQQQQEPQLQEPQVLTESKGMSFEDGGRWLNCTTRHIRIYAGYIDPVTLKMDQTQLDKLSLILDPDDEFVWPGDTPDKVFGKFAELVNNYAGAPLTEYTLRLIGSELEHFIRRMLFANEIKYNLECRVLNFSMGKPRLAIDDEDEEE